MSVGESTPRWERIGQKIQLAEACVNLVDRGLTASAGEAKVRGIHNTNFSSVKHLQLGGESHGSQEVPERRGCELR